MKIFSKQSLFFFFLNVSLNILFIYLFIYLAAPGLSCGTWDPVPRPGIEPRPPALGERSPSHWTTREVPVSSLLFHDYLLSNFLASRNIAI